MDVWEVIARESIRDLVTRYNANGDSGRFDNVIVLFANDAVMELEGEDGPDLYPGRDEILTIFTGTRDRWAGELGGDAPSGPPADELRAAEDNQEQRNGDKNPEAQKAPQPDSGSRVAWDSPWATSGLAVAVLGLLSMVAAWFVVRGGRG